MAPVKNPIEQLFAKLNIDEKCLQYPSACTIKYTTPIIIDTNTNVDNGANSIIIIDTNTNVDNGANSIDNKDINNDIIIAEANLSIVDLITNLALVYTTNDNLSQTLQEYSTTQNVNATLNNALSDYSTTYDNDLKYATNYDLYNTNYDLNNNYPTYQYVDAKYATNTDLHDNYTKTGQDSTYATATNLNTHYSTTKTNDLKYATIANVATTFGNYTTTGNDTNYAKATDLTNTNNNLANNYTKTGQDSTYATATNLNTNYSTTTTNDGKYATIANVATAFGNYTTTGNDTNYAKATDLTTTNNNLANNYTTTGNDTNYAKASNLASYVTNSSLSSTLNGYATTSDLGSYVKTTDLTNYVTQSSLATTLNSYGLNSKTIQINAINNIVTYLQLLKPFAIYDNITEYWEGLYNSSSSSAVNGSTNKPSIANFDTNCSSGSYYSSTDNTACYFVQQYQLANGQLQSGCSTANNKGCLTLPDITTLKTIPNTRLFDDLRNESIDNYSIELNDHIQYTTLHDFKHALSLSGVAVYSF